MPDPADFYTGLVAEVYARLRGSTVDPATYAAFVRAHGEPALELGCGDGDPLLALRRDGLDVEGVDSSSDMLERCRTRAAEAGVDVVLHHQHMEDLALGRTFGAIYLAGPTFTLLPDDDLAARALHGIREHLADAGRALVPLWVPPPTAADELGAVREATASDGATLRYAAVSEVIDDSTRTRTTHTRYERVTAERTDVVERDWVVHWHSPEDFTALCAAAGLDVLDLRDDDTGTAPTPTSAAFTAVLARGRGPEGRTAS